MEPMQQVDAAIDELDTLVAGTRADQLSDPTPCAKWTVHDLINHVVGGGHMFAAAFRGGPPPAPDTEMPDLLGGDPLAAYRAAIADFRDAVRAPGALERVIVLPMGELPGPAVLQLAAADLCVHAWDLATATGRWFEPPAALLDAVEPFLLAAIPAEARDGDTFAAEVEPPSGATRFERLIAFSGRQV